MRGSSLFRPAFLVLLALVAAAVLVRWTVEEPVRVLETPVLLPAPEPIRAGQDRGEEADATTRPEEIRIGSFERPEDVPGYEILERRRDDRDGARILRLLVDTRSRADADYELITRDVKARYAGYDLVSIEFTDSERLLDYNGSALIFNTPEGAAQTGYFYGPPNNRGYMVNAAD